jgi:hypothetical protein
LQAIPCTTAWHPRISSARPELAHLSADELIQSIVPHTFGNDYVYVVQIALLVGLPCEDQVCSTHFLHYYRPSGTRQIWSQISNGELEEAPSTLKPNRKPNRKVGDEDDTRLLYLADRRLKAFCPELKIIDS